jgi:hypothetical protein
VKTKKYIYKPVFVEGVPVTDENMDEVAVWCGGHVMMAPDRFKPGEDARYVKVDALRPLTPRQTQAFAGDIIVKLDKGAGFKVYTKKAFLGTFNEVAEKVDA